MDGAEGLSFVVHPPTTASLSVLRSASDSNNSSSRFRFRRQRDMTSSWRGGVASSRESGSDVTNAAVPVVTRTASGGNRLPRSHSLPQMLRQMTINSTRAPARILSRYRITNDTHVDSLLNLLSGLYAMCLVVMGAALPCAKIFASEISIQTFEAFYVYLFLVGILFIVFIIVFILRDNKPSLLKCLRHFRQKQRTHGDKCHEEVVGGCPAAEKESLDAVDEQTSLSASASSQSFVHMHSSDGEHIAFSMHTRSESFYLRLGAVAFGIASILHTGLNFGQFVELVSKPECGIELILVIRPIVQLVFIFMQLYFIFAYSTICIHRYRKIARFGAMHLIGTNLCVWLRVITIEAVREIHKFLPDVIFDLGFNTAIGAADVDADETLHDHFSGQLVNSSSTSLHVISRRAASSVAYTTQKSSTACDQNSVMSSIVDSSSPYLYPCTIEYYFIAAAIGFVIWSNIGSGRIEDLVWSGATSVSLPPRQSSRTSLFNVRRKKVSVDCSGANRGLFAGILILVLTVISIVVFLVYIDESGRKDVALTVRHSSQIVLYSVTVVVVVAGAYRMRNLRFRQSEDQRLEETLLVLSLIGVFLFRVFNSVAGYYKSHGTVILYTNILITFQAAVQTVFLLNGLHRSAQSQRQQEDKPGLDCITFLLLCNVAVWAVNIFEALRSDTNVISMSFYGTIPWCIITHIVTPLAIFHQFHATVCLSIIWKSAYKRKSD